MTPLQRCIAALKLPGQPQPFYAALDHHEVDHDFHVSQLAVLLHRIGTEPLEVAALRIAVGYEQRFLVRGKQDRARAGGVVRDAHHAPAVVGGLQAQH